MNGYSKSIFLLCCIFITTSSCEKKEGFGGNSNIKGTLIKRVYNDDYSLLLEELPAKDEDVFLCFGNDEVVAEKTETSYTGEFEFAYLFQGNYKVFYYTKTLEDNELNKVEVIQDVSLSKGKTVDLGNLVVNETVDFDEGEAGIKGKVLVKNYYNYSSWPNLVVKDVSPAQQLEIYLVYGNHKQYDKRIRTNYDGTFDFNNLIKGDYLIYLYSDDVKGGTADVVIKKEVTIVDKKQVITIDNITIDNL